MDSTIVTILLGLATILTSGVTSSIVTYRLNRSKEQAFFMRQKAEALYLAANEFSLGFSSLLIGYLPVTRGEISYNQMLDMQIERGKANKNDAHETMIMLSSIYFPEVFEEIEKLHAVRDKYSLIKQAHRTAYHEGDGIGPEWEDAFRKVALDADDAIKKLQASIIRAAEPYSGRKGRRTLIPAAKATL